MLCAHNICYLETFDITIFYFSCTIINMNLDYLVPFPAYPGVLSTNADIKEGSGE